MFNFDRFESLRSSKGISKKHIADALNRQPSLIQAWKNGKAMPNEEQLQIVADILGTTAEYLSGQSDSLSKSDSLWERIESLMRSRNLNQKEFAAAIGVNPVTITEWKKGKSRSYQKIDVMRRIADTLGVSVEELTQENPPIPMSETGNPWAERMRTLTPADLSLFARILESLEANPAGTRAALDRRAVCAASSLM